MEGGYIAGGRLHRIHASLINGLFTVVLLYFALVTAWYTLSAANFGFPLIYDTVGIGENIRVYGPQNRYKQGFERTTRAEHERLFAAIVISINHSGEGLAALRYHADDGADLGAFLRDAEVVHLQDVANLLTGLRHGAWWLGAVAVIALTLAVIRRWQVASLPHVLVGLLGAVCVLGLLLLLFGATELFYKLHELVFPGGHQWFFYYQDSLMTTLMKAPAIFGYMAGFLIGLAITFFCILWLLLRFLLRSLPAKTPLSVPNPRS